MRHESYEETEFEVEQIVNHRRILGTTEFLVKWKGYLESENTWEPEDHLLNCQGKLNYYRRRKMNLTLQSPDQSLNSQDSAFH